MGRGIDTATLTCHGIPIATTRITMTLTASPPTRIETPEHVGVLLINLGTPDAPTPAALRRYLGQFLWDRRIVDIPRPLWWLILHGIILRIRPRRSARAYATVWTE